ncbi:peroxisomal biogenesis factor 16 [Tieghemostelium lacteum]|uniref:Peroxisomal membrane protein PEX16 n=1 Tax=Tieghemostelium lacteum TaxID=361077 RepID=A0A151ZD51_TIELA|nr:peroxisomal biogenesis factor 16 [Tieghemostelium lacteum]|eukprot:KYQ91882.1 peroxisomal biogenesis factor 16 [Tieghemostelium lacteum]
MFLPGRYSDSELFSEALYSITNLFQLFIDYESANVLLLANHSKTSNGDVLPPHYYLPTLKWINIIQNLELFLEVLASKKFSKFGRKTTILIIELLKALLRVNLLIKTNGNMLIHNSFHVPSQDVKSIIDEYDRRNSNSSKESVHDTNNDYIQGKRKTLLDDYKNTSTQQAELEKELKSPPQDSTMIPLLPPYAPRDLTTKVIGELLNIFRPVIYWISRCICDKRSWKPWFISLFIELLSGSFSEFGHNSQPQRVPISTLEQLELNRRKKLLLYYIIRKPFYDKFIGDGVVIRLLNFFKKIPILKILIDILLSYISAMRTRYFYTSTS